MARSSRTANASLPAVQPNDGYPHTDWHAQRSLYSAYWNHFDGDWLGESDGDDSTSLKYPLKLNPMKMACMMHAAFLFGEVPDSNAPLVRTICEPWKPGPSKTERNLADYLTYFVNRVLEENGARTLQQEGGIVSQIMGGTCFQVLHDPDRTFRGYLPIRVDPLLPEFFFPVPSGQDYRRVDEAFVAYTMSRIQARHAYGYPVGEDAGITQDVLYQAHYLPDKFSVTVGEYDAIWRGVPQRNLPNLFYGIPITYIPHIRVGSFYGESLLADRIDLAKEVNARFADIGDIVKENSMQLPAILNVRKITIRRLANGRDILDLGQSIPTQGEPKIIYPTSVQANPATIQWASDLLNLARTEAYTPPIVYGLDEGSQRSALTMAFRMMPLIKHIEQERQWWGEGLEEVARNILLTAASLGLDKRITLEAVQGVKIWQDWAPILPRDREQEVNEIILRVNNGLMPVEEALARLGDIRDIETALKLIVAWMRQKAEIEASAQPQNPFGNSGSSGQNSGLKKPTKPQANMSKDS